MGRARGDASSCLFPPTTNPDAYHWTSTCLMRDTGYLQAAEARRGTATRAGASAKRSCLLKGQKKKSEGPKKLVAFGEEHKTATSKKKKKYR